MLIVNILLSNLTDASMIKWHKNQTDAYSGQQKFLNQFDFISEFSVLKLSINDTCV